MIQHDDRNGGRRLETRTRAHDLRTRIVPTIANALQDADTNILEATNLPLNPDAQTPQVRHKSLMDRLSDWARKKDPVDMEYAMGKAICVGGAAAIASGFTYSWMGLGNPGGEIIGFGIIGAVPVLAYYDFVRYLQRR